MDILTPEDLLNAYASGYFPMADSRDSEALYWFHPEKRGVIPLEQFHVPRSLAKFIRKSSFTLTTDTSFREVITACANRDETWINDRIINLYSRLHEMGFAHSIECWDKDKLIGGLYGVAIGQAFFGESMFSTQPNASRMALVHLVSILNDKTYQLLDTQYVNDHLKQFGIIEIEQKDYLEKLAKAISVPAKAW